MNYYPILARREDPNLQPLIIYAKSPYLHKVLDTVEENYLFSNLR